MLLVVFYTLIHTYVCDKRCCMYIRICLFFFIILQQNIDTVTAERVENVGEVDCIKIKTEQHYMQLVRTVKPEEEVSNVCWCILR